MPKRDYSILTREERAQYVLWIKSRTRARKFNLPFNIEESDIVIPEICPLLNTHLSFGGDTIVTPSLDKINNNLGYVKGNIWVISSMANRMKQNASIEQLRTFAKNVLIHFPD